ncbi:MAG: hypothetical protein NTW16_01915 [Bacteroidetes bacterium]|nr:hypothetical protein [Bacteroidota bacterium]
MKKIRSMMILLLFVTGMIHVNGQAPDEIEKAGKACKPVFLVVFNASGAETDKAVSIANEAKTALKSSSVIIKMNATDAVNSALVAKYRVAGAPMPLILVLDKNSTVAGGLTLKDATAAKLVEMIPTPMTSELLKAINDGKSVYVVAYRETMTSHDKAMNNCAMACGKMDNKSVTIKIDMDDKKEVKLLQTLKCDLNAKEPVTYVINKSGQVIGTHNGITDVNTLVASAKKAPASGCCPGGAPAGGCK